MDTRDYRILPGTGRATVATICGYYKEGRGGVEKPINKEFPSCDCPDFSKLKTCTHYFCTMCRWVPNVNEVEK